MRVLFAGHSLCVPLNQVLCCEIERHGVELTVLAPAEWQASVGGATPFTRHEDLRSETLLRPVRFNGKMQLHYYRGLSARDLPVKPDLVFVDEEAYGVATYQLLRLAQALDVPLVFRTNQNLLKAYPPPFCWMEKAVYRYAPAALPCAEACSEVLRAKGYRGRLEVVGFGLDPAVSRPWPTEALRARLGLPPEAFVVGFMGRFSASKGPMDVVDACLELYRRGAAPYLLMIGAGGQEAELKARAAELPPGRAVFPGIVPHGRAAAEHLGCMSVCVVPSRTTASWKEQFGRVIIEAMASGVPVIGSDSGNVPVLVEETGGGRVFPEGDVAALATTIEALMRDDELTRSLAATGQEHVTREYAFGRLAQRMVDVFGEVVAAK